jgi:hypothetical protein
MATETVSFKQKISKNGYMVYLNLLKASRPSKPIDFTAMHDMTIAYQVLDEDVKKKNVPIPPKAGLDAESKPLSTISTGLGDDTPNSSLRNAQPSFSYQGFPYRIVSSDSQRQVAASPVETASRQPINKEEGHPLDKPPLPPPQPRLPHQLTEKEIEQMRAAQLQGVMDRLLKKKTNNQPLPPAKPEHDVLKEIYEKRKIATIKEPEELTEEYPKKKKPVSPIDALEEELNRMY